MALAKSELCASVEAEADDLADAVDPRQYKDHVLALITLKYGSDKAKVDPSADIGPGTSPIAS